MIYVHQIHRKILIYSARKLRMRNFNRFLCMWKKSDTLHNPFSLFINNILVFSIAIWRVAVCGVVSRMLTSLLLRKWVDGWCDMNIKLIWCHLNFIMTRLIQILFTLRCRWILALFFVWVIRMMISLCTI